MESRDHFDHEFEQHLQVAQQTRERLAGPFQATLALWASAIRRGNKLLFFGNGGSAADAQHLASEFVIGFGHDRPAIAAIALTTDTSALTACRNDLGSDRIFARQLEALGRPKDVAIAISTSGRSPNILEAAKTARQLGLEVTSFTGKGGGPLVELSDIALIVPSDVTARIQEMHMTLGHALCGALEHELGYAKSLPCST